MKLHDYLSSKGIEVDEFAKSAGLSAVAIYKYLSGERSPRKQSLAKLYHATGGAVTANDFFEPPPPTKKRNGKSHA